MRVLHVITSLQTGGVEKLMVDLLPRLKTRGIEVEVLVFSSERTSFSRALEQAGIRIISPLKNKSVYNPLQILMLRKYLDKYDIIHTHNSSPQLFGAIASIGKSPLIVTTEHSTYNRRRDWPWFRPVDRWMYNRYDSVVCVSDEVSKRLKAHLRNNSRAKIETIYNGVDLESIKTAKIKGTLKSGLPAGVKAILMVAAFRYPKDQETLIWAHAQLPEEYHLFLVGEGKTCNRCKLLVEELKLGGRVHFLGLRDDIPSLIKEADVLVLSSRYEGLSLSSIESMASGNPFIASDVPGLHEIVEGAGLLFEPGNPKQLADAILKVTTDGDFGRDVANRCQQRASMFNLDRITEGYISLYDRLINGK